MHSKSFTATMRRMALLIGGTALHILLGQTRLSIGANEPQVMSIRLFLYRGTPAQLQLLPRKSQRDYYCMYTQVMSHQAPSRSRGAGVALESQRGTPTRYAEAQKCSRLATLPSAWRIYSFIRKVLIS